MSFFVDSSLQKPLALILRSNSDVNFYQPRFQHDYQEISNTYDVVVKVLSQNFLWGEAIRETAEEDKRPIQLLCVLTHGNDSSLFFEEMVFKIGDLCAEDFERLAADAVILLYACRVGLRLAAQMAIISRCVVVASKGFVSDCRTTFFMAGPNQPRLLSYDERDNQLMHVFSPEGAEFPIVVSEGIKKEVFSYKLDYLKTLAIARDIEAQYALAFTLLKGLEGQRSIEEAVYWFRLAAQRGESKSQAVLGKFYAEGIYGVPQSDVDALQWFRLAADQQDPVGQYEMGRACYRGLYNLSQSDTEAFYWFQLAADLNKRSFGLARRLARFMIGKFHEKGLGGLEASDREAFFWYETAAQSGVVKAQCKVGLFYATGRKDCRSPGSEAIKWFQMAAKEGMAKAQYFLGLSYETGLYEVSRSLKDAVSWYSLAASQGEPRAIEALQYFTKKT